MNEVRVNDNLHFYLSIGYLLSLIGVAVIATLEYSTIKNDINSLSDKTLVLEKKHFSDTYRIEQIMNENTKSRSKQLIAIRKYLNLCYIGKQDKIALSNLDEDLADLELEINTLK